MITHPSQEDMQAEESGEHAAAWAWSDATEPTVDMLEPAVHVTEPHLPVVAPVVPRKGRAVLRTGASLLLTLLLAAIFATGLFAGWQFGRTGTTTATTGTTNIVQAISVSQTQQEAAIAKVKAAVVEIHVTTASASAIGSGVIVDQRGYIITNAHVVADAQSMTVTLTDGTQLTAQLVGSDSSTDLAVLKITTQKTLTVATLGNSSTLQVGQNVLAIGNPLGITSTVTQGIISAINRSVSESQGGATIANAIQTDAAINPGSSGGVLIDLQGNVVGITTLGVVDSEFNTLASGVGFAIPANTVASVMAHLITA